MDLRTSLCPTYLALVVLLWVVLSVGYNLLFHPLRSYPGPWLSRATRLYCTYIRSSGRSEQKALEWHEKHGSVVRIAPDELSFSGGTAWEDIYGFKNRMQKDPHFYMGAIAPNGEKNMGAADDHDHSRIRGVLAHGFSDRALYAQESLLRGHVEHLIARLRQLKSQPTDVVRWMHHITYDVIAHLCFGHDRHVLDQDQWCPQARAVFEGIREGVTLVEVLRFLPFKRQILHGLVYVFGKARRANFDASLALANGRLESGSTDNVDFISYILRAQESVKELTESELTANICLLIDAGSETTATMLSGCLYFLVANPAILQKLTHTLRTKFPRAEQMTLRALAKTQFLTAVIEESLRVYPSLPATLPRVTPAHGAIVDGNYVPGNTKVGVNQYAAYHSKENFVQPHTFIPERWENITGQFASDRRHVHQPFSMGPRGCLGKNLAWAEMRLTLACLLWNFDLILEPESRKWNEGQLSWFIWNKPELHMRFIPCNSK